MGTLLGTEKEPFLPMGKIRKLPFMGGRPTFEGVREAYLRVASVFFVEEHRMEALTARHRLAPEPGPEEVEEEKKASGKETSKKEGPSEQEAPRPAYREEDDELYTDLHKAAADEDEDRIFELLEAGSDPAARADKGRVPYFLAVRQSTRGAFRKFRGFNEDAFDWKAAQVP